MKSRFSREATFLTKRRLKLATSRVVAKKEGDICSLGTARTYASHVSVFLMDSYEKSICKPRAVTAAIVHDYLVERSKVVRQATLNADRQSLMHVFQVEVDFIVSKLETIAKSRAYSLEETRLIQCRQREKNQFATELILWSGMRAHELVTLSRVEEQRRSSGRPWPENIFFGMNDVMRYTVQGKGGLIREIAIPSALAERLEQQRLSSPRKVKDRKIWYWQRYDIGFGQAWSQSFSDASTKVFGTSCGGHGLRHAYAQRRVRTLLGHGLDYQECMSIVSSELGHFRKPITEVYLR